jgi:hypothetical protein
MIKLSDDGLSGSELFSNVHGPAAIGETGPILFTMDISTNETRCFELTKDQKKDLDDEVWYFDIHSAKCPDDAIRGQILPFLRNAGTIVKPRIGYPMVRPRHCACTQPCRSIYSQR